MGMQVTNLAEVTNFFQLTDHYVNAEARKVFKTGIQSIIDSAKSFAPVDEHRLEKAIHALPFQGNQYMLRVVIDVGGVIAGRSVDEYAAIVHEYPWSKRGPLTRLKGPRAGPRYMVRAVEEHRKKLALDIGKAMNKGISRAQATSGVNIKKRRR